jgi:hypothetical protein
MTKTTEREAIVHDLERILKLIEDGRLLEAAALIGEVRYYVAEMSEREDED